MHWQSVADSIAGRGETFDSLGGLVIKCLDVEEKRSPIWGATCGVMFMADAQGVLNFPSQGYDDSKTRYQSTIVESWRTNAASTFALLPEELARLNIEEELQKTRVQHFRRRSSNCLQLPR